MNDAASGTRLVEGERIYLRHPNETDRTEFIGAVRSSYGLHRPWASPASTDAEFDAYLLRSTRDDFEALLACRREDDRLVGVFNISQIFLGNFQSAYLGYWAVEEFAGRGYMSEALRLVLRHAFTTLRLHRLEANIQPENDRSIALVRRCGFRKEGFSPRYLKVLGRWRDHERWAILKEEVVGDPGSKPG